MKSNYMTSTKPFMWETPHLVDPNQILDYSGSCKSIESNEKENFCNSLSYPENPYDLFDCTDSQLEQLILENDCGLCLSNEDLYSTTKELDQLYENDRQNNDNNNNIGDINPKQQYSSWTENDPFLGEIPSNLMVGGQQPVAQKTLFKSENIENDNLPDIWTHSDDNVANYEEVITDQIPLLDQSISENPTIIYPIKNEAISASTISDHSSIENESVFSFNITSKTNDRKRKSIDYEEEKEEEYDDDDDESYDEKSSTLSSPIKKRCRRRPRAKRPTDEDARLKNKISAMRYRMKKRNEQTQIEEELGIEERRNSILLDKHDELSVQIKVLKELLSKYMDEKKLQLHTS